MLGQRQAEVKQSPPRPWSDTLGTVLEIAAGVSGNAILKQGVDLVKKADVASQKAREHLQEARKSSAKMMKTLNKIKKARQTRRKPTQEARQTRRKPTQDTWSKSPLLQPKKKTHKKK